MQDDNHGIYGYEMSRLETLFEYVELHQFFAFSDEMDLVPTKEANLRC